MKANKVAQGGMASRVGEGVGQGVRGARHGDQGKVWTTVPEGKTGERLITEGDGWRLASPHAHSRSLLMLCHPAPHPEF